MSFFASVRLVSGESLNADSAGFADDGYGSAANVRGSRLLMIYVSCWYEKVYEAVFES